MSIEEFEYGDEGQLFAGGLALPKGTGPHPAVMVAHAWGGRDGFADGKARALADLGYVGFAIDVYGKGRRGGDAGKNAKLMQPLMADRDLLFRRLSLAQQSLAEHPAVDPQRMAAVGFCFGGLCVLDLARGGAPLAGVVAFHGLLQPPARRRAATVRARVLALHGYDDPMAPPSRVEAFAREMSEAGADWQLHAYGGTMHAFTNPAANDPAVGTVYEPRADRRSWAAMTGFLAECLAR